MSTWLKKWEVENNEFWESTGKKIAWRTLIITTIALVISFSTWFVMSPLVIKLQGVGFNFTDSQLFWLAALPGLAGGTLRIIHTFLIPIYGTRHTVTISTFIKIFPIVGLAIAVMNINTPFWVFVILAFSLGFGGGDFSSYMPSTNLFFPSRLKGTALGIQAGIGNFGVSIVQFITPVLFGIGLIGLPQIFKEKEIYLQSPVIIYAPIILVVTVLCWYMLRSVPIKSNFREQLDIFSSKHTWFCTITYFMTFGSFSGLSAAFPMMIKVLYGGFENAPDPLKYAFYGPLVGSASRVLFGFVADKVGGAILTTITGLGLMGGTIILLFAGLVSPTSMEQFPMFITVMMFIFLFTGIGNASTFRQFPIIFKENPRQAAGVIGWTASIAAYGPFVFSILISASISSSEIAGIKNAGTFFWGLLVFLFIATVVNWYYYQRKGCERPS